MKRTCFYKWQFQPTSGKLTWGCNLLLIKSKIKVLPLIFLLSIFYSYCNAQKQQITISSPSGNVKAIVAYNDNKLSYSIQAIDDSTGSIVVPQSPLGLIRNDAEFTNNLIIDSISNVKYLRESYSMVSGKRREISYSANEQIIFLSNSENKKMQVVFRIFDDGVAFRYIFPEFNNAEFSILEEKTGFTVPVTSDGWMSPYELAKPWGQPAYENYFMAVKAGTLSTDSVGWSFPLLFKNGQHWVLISESALDENYCGTHVKKDCSGGLYAIDLPNASERYGDGSIYPKSKLPWVMPWRYIVVSKKLNTVYESNMCTNLAEPCKISNTKWIKPGRSSWEWWTTTKERSVNRINDFIDLSDEMGWEYSVVDAGWNKMPDGTIEDIMKHAKSKKANMLLWYNSGGRRDSSKTNNDFVMYNDSSREAELVRIKKMGFKGIKVDFFATDKQIAIQLYQKILKDAAKHQLLVIFHGCTLPRGWRRTYPNLVAMEAVRGAECYRFDEKHPDKAASFNTICALVRGAVGPTDYTPTTLSNMKYPHKTTNANELALSIVYECGIVTFADKPESYRALPVDAINFLKIVPTVWDETKLISAVPGEHFIIARKNGNKWYIAGINGKNEKQEITFTLPEAMAKSTILCDSDNASEIQVKKTNDNLNTVTITMMPMGGFVIY